MQVKTKHSVYDVEYHLIFVVKDRKPCITKEIAGFLKERSFQLVEGWGGTIHEVNTDKDHIHYLLTLPPTVCIADKVGSLKNSLARLVRKEFSAELRPFLWGDSFWSDSYYLATAGNTNHDIIQNYIQSQGKPKRRYIRKSQEAGKQFIPASNKCETGSSC